VSVDRYRAPEETYTEVRDWDIVLMHGSVRVMGMTHEHLRGCAWESFGATCDCSSQPRISSPIVCPNTRRQLEESWWSSEPTTGEARHLLDATDGTEVSVLSGKVYRLVGRRRLEGHDAYTHSSIFYVYPREDAKAHESPPTVGLWTRVMRALRIAS
jgi:hypothetical protein